MVRTLFLILLLIHAIIHFIGFTKAYQSSSLNQLSENISWSHALIWMTIGLLFLIVASAFYLGREWWMLALFTTILSQILIIAYWQDAKYGTILNMIIIATAILYYGEWDFKRKAYREVNNLLTQQTKNVHVISKEDLNNLPSIIQKWLNKSGIIGKEITRTVSLKQFGEMRTKPDGKWMSVQAEQYFNVQNPGFIWLADAKLAPLINVSAKDKYDHGNGHMLIKLMSLIKVADAKGEEVDQGAMLRFLAEIIWFPSAALGEYITWNEIDANKVEATMSYQDMTVSGIFTFDTNGDIIGFDALRYFTQKEKSTLEKWHISIDQNSYDTFEGIRIPTKGAVTWKLENGDFTWYKLKISEVKYNPIINTFENSVLASVN